MKRLVALALLATLSVSGSVPASAQRLGIEDNPRQLRKAEKKQRKMLNSAVKRQRKAMKKAEKAQRKRTKKANKDFQKRRGL